MLKFRDKDGKLKFIQLDTDEQPIEVSKITLDILKQYGLEEELDDETKKKLKTQGISQDDLRCLTE